MKSANLPLSRHLDIIVQELNDEIIVYDLKTNKAFCLNATSALVWQLCDGKRSVAEISDALGKRLKTSANEDLVWLALNQLREQNLLSDRQQFAPKFNGISRREAIRQVGLGSMIALPVITSLIAPKAISAASGVCGGSCNCSKGNISSQFPALCEAELGGNSACAKRSTCDCLVVGGIGSKGGTCQGV